MKYAVMVRSSSRGWSQAGEYASLKEAKKVAEQKATSDRYAVVHQGDNRGPIVHVATCGDAR